MNYAYVRVSTDRQTIENQRFEIDRFCTDQKVTIDVWYQETISGTRKKQEGEFGVMLRKLRKGDTIIVSELSRLGRNLMEIMSILHDCMEMDVCVRTVKERYELGDNINSKLLAFAFGLSAELERQLISQRTKEALARKKAEGVVLGRPKGRLSTKKKLTDREDEIRLYLAKRLSYSAMARLLGVHRITIANYIKEQALE